LAQNRPAGFRLQPFFEAPLGRLERPQQYKDLLGRELEAIVLRETWARLGGGEQALTPKQIGAQQFELQSRRRRLHRRTLEAADQVKLLRDLLNR
jgi:hypothetical protein